MSSSTHLAKRFFPAPSFLRMAGTGVEISHHSLRVVELTRTAKGYTLVRHGERAVPEGVLSAEKVTQNQEVKDALVSLKKEFGLRFVRVSLPDDKSYIFTLNLPFFSDAQIRRSIELQLEENVPIMASEAVFDYEIMPHVADVQVIAGNEKDEKTVCVSVSVFPKAMIESFTELFHSVGLIPVGFHLNADVIARALIKRDDTKTCLIANLGQKSTGIYIVSHGVVQFTSTLTFGGDALTSAIEKHFKVDHEEAGKIKRGESPLKDKDAVQLFYSLANAASALRDEVGRILSYWHNHKSRDGHPHPHIEKIVLCGSGANLPYFNEYVSSSLSMPVEVANVWQNVCSFDDSIPPLPFTDSLRYGTAIGLALTTIEE